MTITANAKQVLAGNGLKWALVALIDLALLYTIAIMYSSGETLFPLTLLILTSLGNWVFISKNGYCYRYIYPCLLGIILFIIFPLAYTVGISFTNYGTANILPMARVKEIHLHKMVRTDDQLYTIGLYKNGDDYQLELTDKDDNSQVFVSDLFALPEEETQLSLTQNGAVSGEKQPLRAIMQMRSTLNHIVAILPNDTTLLMSSLREFAAMEPQYREGDDDTLIDNLTGEVLSIDWDKGYYVTEAGETVSPGFSVFIGGENYERLLTDDGIRKPFFSIFLWTVLFSFLSVTICAAVGLLLAVLVQWEPLKERGLYRVLLILPYAVPAFISILIFKGLFNQNFGEVNMMLEALFGIRPEWMTNPTLARTMLIMVNVWLGYPYMMIVCMGLLKAIPDDLYEASAIDGAGPIQNLFRITIPNLIKPLAPILIAAFAFNFNNFMLIDLLTGGGPMMPGTTTEAGFTDLLVNFTFRTAFVAGQDFGLASAIATMIFLIVGLLAWINLKATNCTAQGD